MSDDSSAQDLALLLQSDRPVIPPETYKSLDEQRKEIRLVKLQQHNGMIHLTFETYSLLKPSEVVPYDALSYYWGPPTDLKIVMLEETPVQIRSSLFSFLRVLLAHGQSRPIWLDVLCINQDDVTERNWQVSIMGDIYNHAALVRSWLGVAEPDADYALTYARINDSTILDPQVAKRVRNRAREGFRHLLRRPYWERLWIVQEIGLANDVVVHCGSQTVTWTQLMDAFQSLELNSEQSTTREAARNVLELQTLRLSLHDDKKFNSVSLYQRAMQFGDRSCQDPLDKIYGCRSLTHNSVGIRVDYTMPLYDLLMNVVLESLESYNDTTGTVSQAKCTPEQLDQIINRAARLVDRANVPVASYLNELQESSLGMRVVCKGRNIYSGGDVWTLVAGDRFLPDDWCITLPIEQPSNLRSMDMDIIMRASPELQIIGSISNRDALVSFGEHRTKRAGMTESMIMEGSIQPCQILDPREREAPQFGLHLDCIAMLLLIDRLVTLSLIVEQEMIRNTWSRLRHNTKQLCHCQRVQNSQDNMQVLLSEYQWHPDHIFEKWKLDKSGRYARESMDFYFGMYQDYVLNDFQLGVIKMHEYGFVEAFKEVGSIKSHLGVDGRLYDVFAHNFDHELEYSCRMLMVLRYDQAAKKRTGSADDSTYPWTRLIAHCTASRNIDI